MWSFKTGGLLTQVVLNPIVDSPLFAATATVAAAVPLQH